MCFGIATPANGLQGADMVTVGEQMSNGTDLLRTPEAKQLHRPQPQGSHCSSKGKPHTETYTGGKTATSQTEDNTKGEEKPIRVYIGGKGGSLVKPLCPVRPLLHLSLGMAGCTSRCRQGVLKLIQSLQRLVSGGLTKALALTLLTTSIIV
ncbi:hypothetical protein NQZ68_024663 [Dissostichus eleginoides]|nr:hypothetical protein NQZ68_024663 [Dissostichus eleginoides]